MQPQGGAVGSIRTVNVWLMLHLILMPILESKSKGWCGSLGRAILSWKRHLQQLWSKRTVPVVWFTTLMCSVTFLNARFLWMWLHRFPQTESAIYNQLYIVWISVLKFMANPTQNVCPCVAAWKLPSPSTVPTQACLLQASRWDGWFFFPCLSRNTSWNPGSSKRKAGLLFCCFWLAMVFFFKIDLRRKYFWLCFPGRQDSFTNIKVVRWREISYAPKQQVWTCSYMPGVEMNYMHLERITLGWGWQCWPMGHTSVWGWCDILTLISMT